MKLPWAKKKYSVRVSSNIAAKTLENALGRGLDFSVRHGQYELLGGSPYGQDLINYIDITVYSFADSQALGFAIDDARGNYSSLD